MADATLAYISLAVLIVLITSAIFYLQYVFNKGNENAEDLPPEPVVERRGATNRRDNVRARLRARLAERNASEEAEAEEYEDDSPHEFPAHEQYSDGEADLNIPQSKTERKKAAKLQMKEEKRLMKEREQKEREERKKQEELKREEERKREEEEEEEEKRKEEEERRLLEEKEQREQEEYEKMRTAFVVEDEGYDQINPEEEKDLLKEFVEHIKNEKVVVLEELASRFSLKTQAVINRINELLDQETLSGVMDDRGKFIYVSHEELQKIAKFIRQRGRVSLAEIVEESSTLVSLATVAE